MLLQLIILGATIIIYRSNLIILGAKVRQKIEFHKSERKFFPKVLLIFP